MSLQPLDPACVRVQAFFGGGDRELQIVNKRFQAMLEHDWMRLYANFKFQIVEDVFRSRVPDILQWVLRFTYGVTKGGTDEQILNDGGRQLNLAQSQLVSMSGMVFGELGVLLGLAEKFVSGCRYRQRRCHQPLSTMLPPSASSLSHACTRAD